MDEKVVIKDKKKYKQDNTRRARNNRMMFRLSDEEKAKLESLVEKSGQNKEKYIRKAVFDFERKIYNTDGFKLIIPEFKRLGNNVNQITAKLNSGGKAPPEEWQFVKKEFEELWQQLRQLVAELR